jgi:hypothetical protein
MTDWFEYEAKGDDFVPVEKWGKDHWSTLAYLETRCVDGSGKIENGKMRCNHRRHREFYAARVGHSLSSGIDYPTRLAGGEELENHDDWSCLEDMVKAGLVKAWFRVKNHLEAFGGSEACVELTELGWKIAHALRKHRAAGLGYGEFRVQVPPWEVSRDQVS